MFVVLGLALSLGLQTGAGHPAALPQRARRWHPALGKRYDSPAPFPMLPCGFASGRSQCCVAPFFPGRLGILERPEVGGLQPGIGGSLSVCQCSVQEVDTASFQSLEEQALSVWGWHAAASVMTVHSHGTLLQEHDARTDTELGCKLSVRAVPQFRVWQMMRRCVKTRLPNIMRRACLKIRVFGCFSTAFSLPASALQPGGPVEAEARARCLALNSAQRCCTNMLRRGFPTQPPCLVVCFHCSAGSDRRMRKVARQDRILFEQLVTHRPCYQARRRRSRTRRRWRSLAVRGFD